MKPEEGRKLLSNLIHAEKSFNFRPYAYTPRGVIPNLFYAQSSEEISLVPLKDVPIDGYFLLVVIVRHSSLQNRRVARYEL